MPGLFLSLDGVDGGGKSTQIQLLRAWFEDRGRETVVVRDPGGTRLGEALREILLHRQEIPLSMTAEMLLYMASRAQLVTEVIQPALNEGKVVLSDRFLLANIVYQGWAGGLDVEQLWLVGAIATGGLQPDLICVLDLPPEMALLRIERGLDRLESRGQQFMHSVRDGFLAQARRLGEQCCVLDATLAPEAIHQQIVQRVAQLERPTIEP